ncbi:hypothetical protein MASR1M65_11750 [Saprospiraceae bacterium]
MPERNRLPKIEFVAKIYKNCRLAYPPCTGAVFFMQNNKISATQRNSAQKTKDKNSPNRKN